MRSKHYYIKESGNRKSLVVSYKAIESEGYVELTQKQIDFLLENLSATTEEIENCEMSDSVNDQVRRMLSMIHRHIINHPVEGERRMPGWNARRMNGRMGGRFQ